MDDTSPLARRDKETAEAHRALLLWAMCAPDKRSKTAMSRVTGIGESSIRHYHRVQEWDARVTKVGDDAGEQAVVLYRGIYEQRYGVQAIRALRDHYRYLRAAYVLPDDPASDPAPSQEPEPPPEPKFVAPPTRASGRTLAKDEEARQIQEDAKAALKDRRLNSICDAAEIRLVQGLASGKVKVTLADLERILKIRVQLEKLKAPPILGEEEGGKARESVAKSERVQFAIANGGDVLRAILDDTEEIRLIATVLTDHEAQARVLQFPGKQQSPEKG